MTHTLNLSPEWEFTRSVTRRHTTFAFHRSSDCPGYELELSNWRLTKMPRPEDHRGSSTQSVQDEWGTDEWLKAIEHLRVAVGEQAFELSDRALRDVKNAAFALQSGTPPLRGFVRRTPQQELDRTMLDFKRAFVMDLLAPDVGILSVPLLHLTIRDKCSYVIGKKPWPYNTPPLTLQHFAASGFASGAPWGIVAQSPAGIDLWIVSRFSQCEVEVKWNRKATILPEYPSLNDLPGSQAGLLKLLSKTLTDTFKKEVGPLVDRFDTAVSDVEKRTAFLEEIERRDRRGTAVESLPRTAPDAEHVFRRLGDNGDFWEIVFEGHKLHPVRHLAGMTYLRALLAQPGHDFPALDLYEMENPPPPEAVAPPKGNVLDPEERERYGSGGSTTRLMDLKTRTAAVARKTELEEEIKDSDLSIDEKGEREEEIERLSKALASDRVARAIGGATFENAQTKRPRQTVSKAIDKAVDALAESPALMKHLTTVHKGRSLRYSGGLTWET